ncbi:hypothetical protein GTQ43_40360 [Nostoc sp. KVJ3]|uniref:hypothetical protein n=1 Tax=Nostoc sp. KVJ3 TaxID=457945 RepID=UPI002237F5FE|nr:hypothetical protein [Nostoc sp. KVJ3]MCW5319574.1 hypothetical protein [Nostoc sp. KVJ3]
MIFLISHIWYIFFCTAQQGFEAPKKWNYGEDKSDVQELREKLNYLIDNDANPLWLISVVPLKITSM